MEYRIRADGSLKNELEIRNLFPNTLLPLVFNTDVYEAFGFDPVLNSPQPDITVSQYVIRNGVVQDGLSNWIQAWTVVDFSPAEILSELDSLKQLSIASIDTMHDKIVYDRVGNRGVQYTRAETNARAFKAAGYTGTPEKTLQDWSTTSGLSLTDAADNIIAQADAWLTALDVLYAKRISTKQNIRDAGDKQGIYTILVDWHSFEETIRTQLAI